MTLEQLQQRGLFNPKEYEKIKEYMIRNNEQNDIENNKTNWKYFYNIWFDEILDRLNFIFTYNMKPCYYDLAFKKLSIVLCEDLKITVSLELNEILDFLKGNKSLFDFKQVDGMYYEGDRIKTKSNLQIIY